MVGLGLKADLDPPYKTADELGKSLHDLPTRVTPRP
jgi:hypothetical protein